MLIFAYGSNLCLTRLKDRTPSAKFITIAKLPGHVLKFNKIGMDGSAKANAIQTDNSEDYIFGAVFEISETEKPILDLAEGLEYGYIEKVVRVEEVGIGEGRCEMEAYMYFGQEEYIIDDIEPYSWYMEYILAGAEDVGLPDEYIMGLKKVVGKEDQDFVRRMLNENILELHREVMRYL